MITLPTADTVGSVISSGGRLFSPSSYVMNSPASLPMIQFAGCGAEFVASALVLGFAGQTATVLGVEIENALFAAFGL